MRAPSKEETKNEIPEELGLPGDNSIQVKKVRVKIMDESKEPACAYSMCVIEDKTTTECKNSVNIKIWQCRYDCIVAVINEFEQHVEQLKQDDGKGFTAEFDVLYSPSLFDLIVSLHPSYFLLRIWQPLVGIRVRHMHDSEIMQRRIDTRTLFPVNSTISVIYLGLKINVIDR